MTSAELGGLTGSRQLGRVLAVTTIGNLVEWYDFLVYAYLTPVLAGLFFPGSDRATGILTTLAIYGVSFFVRPVASFFWGPLGDRVGRRAVLSAVIVLMGISTLGLGLLPTHAQVGTLAPVLLLLVRILQGFAATGEWVGSLSYLLENTAPRGRGALLGVNSASGIIPGPIAALVVFAVQSSMTQESFTAWGWRVPFVIGGILALVGLYVRLRMEETPAFRQLSNVRRTARTPIRSCFRRYPRQLAAVFVVASLMSLGSYGMLTSVPTYLSETVKLAKGPALLISAAAALVFTFAIPLFGRLGDRVGRRPLVLTGAGLLVAGSVPSYLLLDSGSLAGVFAGQAILGISTAVLMAGGVALMVEIFPTNVRLTGGVISQTFAYTIFGGTVAFVNQALVVASGSALAPGFYLTACAVIVLPLSVWLVPETRGLPLLREADTADGAASRVAISDDHQ
ncbi:MAG TPA: MFS transporter [Amycolatopsis sp.]|nr:MFS transporter [Amycolatopsis sp.]